LQQSGIRRVHLATHYKAEMIEQHFGDGQRFGVDISYITEQEPLGTAGALAQLEDDDEPVLVMNGDILSDIHIPSMLDYHRAHDAALTVAVRPYEIQVPYGVLRTSGTEVTGIDEKPVLAPLVNAGIYLLQPAVLQLVPQGQRFDMPQLIEAALARRLKVISFPLREYWIDIGQAEDYRRALVSYPTVPRDR
jgi:NDP-sugar pyrophosphorylase family protein